MLDIETFHNHFTVTLSLNKDGATYEADYWTSPGKFVRPSNVEAKYLSGRCRHHDADMAVSLAVAEIDLLDGPVILIDEGRRYVLPEGPPDQSLAA